MKLFSVFKCTFLRRKKYFKVETNFTVLTLSELTPPQVVSIQTFTRNRCTEHRTLGLYEVEQDLDLHFFVAEEENLVNITRNQRSTVTVQEINPHTSSVPSDTHFDAEEHVHVQNERTNCSGATDYISFGFEIYPCKYYYFLLKKKS